MTQHPEQAVYSFSYKDGWPISFAKFEVWAEVTKGSGRKILVLGGVGQTIDGNGMLPRIPRQPSWNQPEFRLIDEAAGRRATFDLYAWHYTLDWERPAAFAEFDRLPFKTPADFFDYLATRYSFLTNMQPSPLDFKLIRVGSPAEFPNSANLFNDLRSAMQDAWQHRLILDPGDSKDLVEHVDEQMMKPARHLMWAVSQFIPINARTFGRHTHATLFAAYSEMLKKIATGYRGLPLPSIMQAIQRTLKGRVSRNLVISEEEDWALAGLLIFLAGLVPFGYGFAAFDQVDDPNLQILTIKMALAK